MEDAALVTSRRTGGERNWRGSTRWPWSIGSVTRVRSTNSMTLPTWASMGGDGQAAAWNHGHLVLPRQVPHRPVRRGDVNRAASSMVAPTSFTTILIFRPLLFVPSEHSGSLFCTCLSRRALHQVGPGRKPLTRRFPSGARVKPTVTIVGVQRSIEICGSLARSENPHAGGVGIKTP